MNDIKEAHRFGQALLRTYILYVYVYSVFVRTELF